VGTVITVAENTNFEKKN